jgi:FMN-dependent NADH-azoreductase
MTTLLHLNSSARLHNSASRQLTAHFIRQWLLTHPTTKLLTRDLGHYPVPAIDDRWVQAYETEPADRTPNLHQALTLSDQLIDELLSADLLLFGVPMYNLTIPASLKAYLDQLIRRDRLPPVTDPSQSLLSHKWAIVITSRKFDYRPGSGRESRDFLEPYLRAIFSVIGLTQVQFVHADRLADPAQSHQSLTDCRQQLDQLAASITLPNSPPIPPQSAY